MRSKRLALRRDRRLEHRADTISVKRLNGPAVVGASAYRWCGVSTAVTTHGEKKIILWFSSASVDVI